MICPCPAKFELILAEKNLPSEIFYPIRPGAICMLLVLFMNIEMQLQNCPRFLSQKLPTKLNSSLILCIALETGEGNFAVSSYIPIYITISTLNFVCPCSWPTSVHHTSTLHQCSSSKGHIKVLPQLEYRHEVGSS